MRLHELLTEATFDLDEQVDYIYNKFFKKYCEGIINDEKATEPQSGNVGTTEMLPKSDLINKANRIQTCNILINVGGNAYVPHRNEIKFSINESAINFLISQGVTLDEVDSLLDRDTAYRFKKEFSQARVKGSIYHELSHWLDNVLHGGHIKRKIDKHVYSSDPDSLQKHLYHGEKDAMTTSYEIDAQIHSIKQLKRDYPQSLWDIMSFSDMLKLNSSLSHLYDDAVRLGIKDRWFRKLKSRMSREGLLGDKMR